MKITKTEGFEDDRGPIMWFGQETIDFKFKYVATGTIEPGCTRGGHYHKKIDEKILCVYGSLEFTLDDETSILYSGDMVDVPPGTVHTVKNIGYDTAFFVEIKDREITNEDKDTYRKEE